VGDATLVGMKDGFYTFHVTRTGWEPLSYTPPPNAGFVTVGGKVRLIRSHYGSVFLRPVKQDLSVTVKGYDPVKEEANRPLKGITVKLTGVDFTDDTVTLVPPQSIITGEDGTYKFEKLAPIRWKIEAGRMGYAAVTSLVSPNANGTFQPQTLELQLKPTKVKVVVASPYQTGNAVKGANVRLQGIRNSNTEGIERDLEAQADAAGHTASATFANLLPGRYWIHLLHATTLSDLPSRSGPLFGPSSFQVAFFPKETFAEVAVEKTEQIRVNLEPVPARVRGRLWATDELGDPESTNCDPEDRRVFRLIAQKGITFVEHKSIKLLASTNNSLTIDTDAAGGYTALVPPGIFGVQIPAMTEYTGHNIEFGDLTEGQAPYPGPWPYPDICPYSTYEPGHHGAGVRLDFSHEYQLDLFVHRQYVSCALTPTDRRSRFTTTIWRPSAPKWLQPARRRNAPAPRGGRPISCGMSSRGLTRSRSITRITPRSR